MFITELQLYNFKNHQELHLNLDSKVVGIYGLNGAGKTNVLDAIYMLSCLKSNFTSVDSQITKLGSDFYSIKGWYNSDKSMELLLKFDQKHHKSITVNGKKHKRLIDHIGFIPAVFICPYDISLVLELADERRRFIDLSLSQVSSKYLNQLALYKKILTNRNAFLKNNEGRPIDPILIESYDTRLSQSATLLHGMRSQFIKEIKPEFEKYYQELSQGNESIELSYQSDLNHENMDKLLEKNLYKDIAAQRTTVGVHKDDLDIQLNGLSLRKFGSQGQIKSAIIALKIAQYHYFKAKTNKQPILLLDDIFEKIDMQRAKILMQLISKEEFGQIIISDTEQNRMEQFLSALPVATTYIEIAK